MKIEQLKALRINCPEWYQRPDFIDWLDIYTGAVPDDPYPGWPVATWHKPGQLPGDMSDIFMVFDHGEGSEMGICPVWDEITEICEEAGFEWGVVWLVNVEAE